MLDQMAQAWLDSVERKDAVITLLTGERNDARAEVVQLQDELDRLSNHYQGLMRECDAKDAEIERLRAALQSITEVASGPLMWQIAAAALEIADRQRATRPYSCRKVTPRAEDDA